MVNKVYVQKQYNWILGISKCQPANYHLWLCVSCCFHRVHVTLETVYGGFCLTFDTALRHRFYVAFVDKENSRKLRKNTACFDRNNKC